MRINQQIIAKTKLEYILGNYSNQDFINQFWTKDYLYIPGAEDKFQGLLSFDDINGLLQKFKLDVPNIRLVKDGKSLTSEEITVRNLDSYYVTEKMPFLNIASIISYLQNGYVMAIDDINQFVDSLYLLRMNLEWQLKERVKMNCYLGKEQSKGFGVHWDNHDVIVLQIYGKKDWSLYGFTETYPLKPHSKQDNPPKDIIKTVTMTPGDVLYFPRGYWHSTQAIEDYSLHVTIGIHNKTAIDYLKWLSNQVIESDFFRQPLPQKTDELKIGQFNKDLAQQLNLITAHKTLDEFYSETESCFYLPCVASLPYSIIDDFNFDSNILFRLNTFRPLNITEANGLLTFVLQSKKWTLNIVFKEVLALLNTGDFFSIQQLHEQVDSKLDLSLLTRFCRGLIQKGVLLVCETN